MMSHQSVTNQELATSTIDKARKRRRDLQSTIAHQHIPPTVAYPESSAASPGGHLVSNGPHPRSHSRGNAHWARWYSTGRPATAEATCGVRRRAE